LLERLLRHLGIVLALKMAAYLVPERQLFLFEWNLIERRELAVEIFVDHHLAQRHAVGELAQEPLPVRMIGIGDRPHDHPVLRRRDRDHFAYQLLGLAGIGADDAGDESHIDAGGFRLFECADLAQRPHHRRQPHRIGFRAVIGDPSAHRVD